MTRFYFGVSEHARPEKPIGQTSISKLLILVLNRTVFNLQAKKGRQLWSFGHQNFMIGVKEVAVETRIVSEESKIVMGKWLKIECVKISVYLLGTYKL